MYITEVSDANLRAAFEANDQNALHLLLYAMAQIVTKRWHREDGGLDHDDLVQDTWLKLVRYPYNAEKSNSNLFGWYHTLALQHVRAARAIHDKKMSKQVSSYDMDTGRYIRRDN